MSSAALFIAVAALMLVIVLGALEWHVRDGDLEREVDFRRSLSASREQESEDWQQLLVSHQADEVAARNLAIREAKLPVARRPFDLDPDERIRLQERWREGQSCAHCGWMHNGVCPRVAKIMTERRGAIVVVTTEYWPNSQWEPPADAMSGRDLWEGASPPPQQRGEPDGTSGEQAAG